MCGRYKIPGQFHLSIIFSLQSLPPFCTAPPLSGSCSLPFSLMWASLNASYPLYPPFFSTSNDRLSPFHSRMFCCGLLQLGVCQCCAFHSLPSQFSTTCCPLLVDTRVQYTQPLSNCFFICLLYDSFMY